MLVTIFPSLIAIDTLVVGIFLLCHVISQNQVTKGSCDFERESLIVSHNPTTFGGHRHFGSGDVLSLSRDLPKPSDFTAMGL